MCIYWSFWVITDGVKGIESGADVRKNRKWCKPMSSGRYSRGGKWIPYGTYRVWKRFTE